MLMFVVIITDSSKPVKKTKAELEEMIKANGGNIFQTHTAAEEIICIADRSEFSSYIISISMSMTKGCLYTGTVKVASLQKLGKELIRPCWIFDCLRQNEIDNGRARYLLPLEPK